MTIVHRGRTALATLTLLTAFAAGAHAQPTESVWEASSGLTPEQVCPPWTLVDTAPGADPTFAGGALVLTTAANGEDMLYVQSGFPLPAPDPLVVEARMRFISGSSSANNRGPAAIAITSAANTGTLFFIGADEIFLTASGDVRGQSATVDTDGAAHTYRITVAAAGTVTVFYDGAPTLTGATYTSASVFGSQGRIIWGEGAGEAFGSHAWESVRHNAATCQSGTTTTTTSTVAPTTSGPIPSTTVVHATSTTAPTNPESSTTTVTAPSMTTTTAMRDECNDEVRPGSLDAVLCRFDVLSTQITQHEGLGTFRGKLQSALSRAIMRGHEADQACMAGDLKTARRRMKQTNRYLLNMAHRLNLLRARHQLDPQLRSDFITMIESIRADVVALRRNPCG